MAHRVFVSYASGNRRHPTDQEMFDRFLDDLINEISINDASIPLDDIGFFASRDIETGKTWPASLELALRTARVLLAFYSSHYFGSPWCGREVQVFLERGEQWARAGHPPPQVVMPILWMPVKGLPARLRTTQFDDAAFPATYHTMGLRKIMELALDEEYTQVKTVLAARILEAIADNHMPDAPPLADMSSLPSAFDPPAAPVPAGPSQTPTARRAYFVFAAGGRNELAGIKQGLEAWGQSGWDWTPYHPVMSDTVGALAQMAAGNKNLRFVELACDATLPDHLRQAKSHKAPVVLLADPWTVGVQAYRAVLEEYDNLMLLNCALLVPWNDADAETSAQRTRLERELRSACSQKMKARMPGHYWSIRSADELRSRLLTILDEITMQLVDAADPGDLQPAQSAELEAGAAEQGIATDKPSQLINTGGEGPRLP